MSGCSRMRSQLRLLLWLLPQRRQRSCLLPLNHLGREPGHQALVLAAACKKDGVEEPTGKLMVS